ncbi:hypothetical protein IFM89_037703 [Coptis chinensis]|uniref:Uncharacterized protein n=1 Tax=Coptis chinensis TaxID=261450 RepID=A0A835IGR4_9MAGN|nr:hypothetical protein IFM89_037703 [Coptis chinensis]
MALVVLDKSDAVVFSNRSHCFACTGDGESAWSDAKSLHKKFDVAADAFLMGLKLNPENKELQDAFGFSFLTSSIEFLSSLSFAGSLYDTSLFSHKMKVHRSFVRVSNCSLGFSALGMVAPTCSYVNANWCLRPRGFFVYLDGEVQMSFTDLPAFVPSTGFLLYEATSKGFVGRQHAEAVELGATKNCSYMGLLDKKFPLAG